MQRAGFRVDGQPAAVRNQQIDRKLRRLNPGRSRIVDLTFLHTQVRAGCRAAACLH
jgi:hypothetical protein